MPLLSTRVVSEKAKGGRDFHSFVGVVMRLSELEDRKIEMIQSEHQRKNAKSLRDLGNYSKRLNMCVIGVLEGEENDMGLKSYSKK